MCTRGDFWNKSHLKYSDNLLLECQNHEHIKVQLQFWIVDVDARGGTDLCWHYRADDLSTGVWVYVCTCEHKGLVIALFTIIDRGQLFFNWNRPLHYTNTTSQLWNRLWHSAIAGWRVSCFTLNTCIFLWLDLKFKVNVESYRCFQTHNNNNNNNNHFIADWED